MMTPPTIAPGIEVKPPRISTGSALRARVCNAKETSERAPHMMPVASATIPAANHTVTQICSSEMPTDSAALWLSVGISLEQIWVTVWFAAGIVALATGIMWGARSDVSFALQTLALKALPVLILGGFTSIPGAIVGGVIIGVGEKLGEFYWGPLLGSGIESWLAYVIALVFLLFRPQGLFGEKIIERI